MTASIELATGPMEFSALEKVLLQGDLKALTPEERIDYYGRVCNSLGLNPLTRPFQYIEFVNNGVKRLSLYAAKDCTEQLANRHIISVIPDEGSGNQGYVDCPGRRQGCRRPDRRSHRSRVPWRCPGAGYG